MVDGLPLYGFCRCQGSVKRGATSLAYWGIFSPRFFADCIIRLRIKKQTFCASRTFLLNNLAFFKVFV